MDEINFKNWQINKGINHKVASDNISRLKRIEREINHCDIDEHYRSDKCKYLMDLFLKSGKNEEMQKYNSTFPIGKYYMSTFRHALKLYVQFKDEESF